MNDAEYFQWQGSQLTNWCNAMTWLRTGIAELKEYAGKFPKVQAFVIGMGPSLDDVSTMEWSAISRRWFTVGANFLPVRQKEMGLPYPSLVMAVDDMNRARDDAALAKTETLVDAIKEMHSCGCRALMSFSARTLPYNWTCPMFACPPMDNGDFVLTTTGQMKYRFSRTTIAAIHVLALLGFRNICLLGVDHGGDYGNKRLVISTGKLDNSAERKHATFAYGSMAEWMGKRKPLSRLWQCGSRAAWKAENVGQKSLAAAIKGRW